MSKFSLFALLCASVLIAGGLEGQVLTTVSFDSGNQLLYSNATKTVPLMAGAATTAGDGAVIRLGYYSSGTNASPFSGTFTSLAGTGTLNTTYANITIGDSPADSGGGAGTFALTLNFTPGNSTTGNSLPAAGVPLVIQFYDNTTIATSTAFNAVSNALWDWKTPATPGPTVTITLDDANLQWLGGAASAFYTSQPVVPEPSSVVLLGMSTLGLIGWARVRRHV